MQTSRVIHTVSCYAEGEVGELEAVIPSVSGRAWVTGTHQHMLDSDDPWPGGYRIADT